MEIPASAACRAGVNGCLLLIAGNRQVITCCTRQPKASQARPTHPKPKFLWWSKIELSWLYLTHPFSSPMHHTWLRERWLCWWRLQDSLSHQLWQAKAKLPKLLDRPRPSHLIVERSWKKVVFSHLWRSEYPRNRKTFQPHAPWPQVFPFPLCQDYNHTFRVPSCLHISHQHS